MMGKIACKMRQLRVDETLERLVKKPTLQAKGLILLNWLPKVVLGFFFAHKGAGNRTWQEVSPRWRKNDEVICRKTLLLFFKAA